MVDVVVVGAGPTGLMLAAELALAGVETVIVDKRPDGEVTGSRSGGLHSRTVEMLDQRGVVDRFLAEGKPAQVVGFGYTPLDISDFPTRHPYGLALWQKDFERILAQWVAELGVTVNYGKEVIDFSQDDVGVDIDLADGRSLRAQFLVGCDGGRSLTRKHAGIEFPGWSPTMSSLVAEVELGQEPQWGLHRDELGVHAFGKLEDGRARLVVTEREIERGGEATLEDLRKALMDVWGTDYGVHGPAWVSRFTDAARQAAQYRVGRVLLAGDAAHVHSPVGGQGLNTGVQDAWNLGWKLAQVVKGLSPESLLDTYHAERHQVGARVLHQCLAQNALMRVDDRTQALSETVAALVVMDEPRKSLGGMLSGLDIHYDIGEGHPLLGRRMPDLDLETTNGPTRVFELLHDAKPVLLNFDERQQLEVPSLANRLQLVNARDKGGWDLPVLGAVESPTAVLLRPDGYVARVGQGSDQGMRDALSFWFGRELDMPEL